MKEVRLSRHQALINFISKPERLKVTFVLAERRVDLLPGFNIVPLLQVACSTLVMGAGKIVPRLVTLLVPKLGRSLFCGLFETSSFGFALAVDDQMRRDEYDQFGPLQTLFFMTKPSPHDGNGTDEGQAFCCFYGLFRNQTRDGHGRSIAYHHLRRHLGRVLPGGDFAF